jgi:transposase-like protein
VEQWRESGFSAAEICRREGWNLVTFYSWRRKFDNPEAPRGRRTAPKAGRTAFLPIHVVNGPHSAEVVVTLTDGTAVRAPVGCDLAWLQGVLSAVERRSC